MVFTRDWMLAKRAGILLPSEPTSLELGVDVSRLGFGQTRIDCKDRVTTYVPATTPGKFWQVAALRSENDEGRSSGTGIAELKVADWVKAARTETVKIRMFDRNIGHEGMVQEYINKLRTQ